MTASSWYVVTAPPLREFKARDALDRAGFQVWLPECVVRVRRRRFAGYVENRPGPLFPGYLFVEGLPGTDWRRIERPPVDLAVLRRTARAEDETPALLPAAAIAALRAMLDAERGRLSIEKGRPKFERGQRVRIAGELWQDWEGLYVACGAKKRIKILLDVMGSARVVDVAEALVFAA